MDERAFGQIQDIFISAVDLPIEAQAAAIEQMYQGDAAQKDQVLDRVKAMLEEDRCANPLLDSSLDETVRGVLGFGALPSLVQREIGPYRLLKFLGEGGMGVVYLAERKDIGGQVAIKLLRDARKLMPHDIRALQHHVHDRTRHGELTVARQVQQSLDFVGKPLDRRELQEPS